MAIQAVSKDVYVDAGRFDLTRLDPTSPRRGSTVRSAIRPDPAAEPPFDLASTLRGAFFEIAATFEVAPPIAATPQRSGRRAPGQVGEPGAPRVSAAVGPNESVVLLIESTEGVFSWQTDGLRTVPTERRGAGGRSAFIDFTLGPNQVHSRGTQRRGVVLDWIGEKLLGRLRVYVLRFVVTKTIEAAVKRIEGDNPTGPVQLIGPDPKAWIPGPMNFLPPSGRPARVLLLVHGTFSSTMGSFGPLSGTDAGTTFLASLFDRESPSAYDLIVGYDHHTLADDPRANAEAILAMLTSLSLPARTIIDAVAYSRGGLVYRALAEELLPGSGLDVEVGKAIFVACTNAGTNLAEPRNWADLIDLYTNIIIGSARAASAIAGFPLALGVDFSVRTLGKFVQMLSQVAISERKLPGLAAMEPDSPLIAALNHNPDADRLARYRAVTSNFSAKIGTPKGLSHDLCSFLGDRIVDRLFQVDNDLVVNTASMTDFGRGAELSEGNIFAFGTTDEVYHTIYFGDEKVANQLAKWLTAVSSRKITPLQPKRTFDESKRPDKARRSVSTGTAKTNVPDGVERHFAAISKSDAATEDDEIASRSRYLAAEMEPSPVLGAAVNVFVVLSRSPVSVAGHASSASTPVELAPTEKLEVRLIPVRNCRLAAGENGTCEFDPSLLVEAVIRMRVEGQSAGPGEILLEARQGNAVLSSLVLRPMFIDPQAKAIGQAQIIAGSPGEETFPTLRIYEFRDPADRITLRFDLSGGEPAMALSESWTLDPKFNVGAYVGGVLAEVEAAWNLAGDSYEAFLASFSDSAIVRAQGLVPPSVRAALWEERQTIKSIQIVSDEALIPWELLCIADPSGQSDERRGFLSEWGVVRWFHGVRPPPQVLGFSGSRSRSVIPDYADPALALSGVDQERAMLEHILPGIREIAATSLEVRRFLAKDAADLDVLHFACHGEASDKAVLTAKLLMTGNVNASGQIIEDGFSSDQVKVNLRMSPERARSLVFLNSCQTGRGGRGIAGVAGFADAFIRPNSGRGAAAFIGALWSIDTTLAATFADTFYMELREGSTLVEAVGAARDACTDQGDFTWLAYSVYGHPLAKAERSLQAGSALEAAG